MDKPGSPVGSVGIGTKFPHLQEDLEIFETFSPTVPWFLQLSLKLEATEADFSQKITGIIYCFVRGRP